VTDRHVRLGVLRYFSIALLLLIGAPLAVAQAATAVASPAYDVVTIKPNDSGGGTSFNTGDDSFHATNMSIRQMLVYSFGIRDGLISGLPGWAESARFDILAKIVDYDQKVKLSREQRRSMLGVVLTERFHLKDHTEIKQLPVYELTVGKGGPKFKPNPATVPGGDALPNDGPPRGGTGINLSNGTASLTGNTVPMSILATDLSEQLDRTVIDRTGLNGLYDFHLSWTADNASPVAEDAPPSLFTALQDQLGLRLQPGKGPVKTLVVDHLEMPAGN
jgi:uncharacterized protein (TIGR03435 family)